MQIEGREGCAGRGEVAVVTAGDWHTYASAAENCFVVLECEAQLTPARLFDAARNLPFVPLNTALREQLNLAAAHRELLANSERTARAWGDLILALLEQQSLPPRRTDPRVQQALTLMARHFREAWPVPALAQAVGLRTSHFHELFRRATGQTPRARLQALRVAHARALLLRSDLGVAAIAQQSGFCDQAALTRAFRQRLGETPARYRARHRAEEMQLSP